MAKKQTLDPIAQRAQARYRQEGLTYLSNNINIMPRDEAGNIIMNEGVDNNPLLIIEAAAEKVTTNSLLRVLDTRFQYYKFPVQVRSTGSLNLDINLDINTDPVYARYKPLENSTINAAGIPSGIFMDQLVEGLPQIQPNTYYVSKEVKNSGVDLRIRAKISHYFLSSGGFGTCYFTLMRGGPNKPLDRYYRPGQNQTYASTSTTNPYDFDIAIGASQFLTRANTYIDLAKTRINTLPAGPQKDVLTTHFDAMKVRIPSDIQSVVIPGYRIDPNLITLYGSSITNNLVLFADLKDEYDQSLAALSSYRIGLIQAADIDEPVYGSINSGETQILYIDEVIPNSEFDIGDTFAIGAFAGQADQHTIFAEQSYMVVTDASKNVDVWNQPVE